MLMCIKWNFLSFGEVSSSATVLERFRCFAKQSRRRGRTFWVNFCVDSLGIRQLGHEGESNARIADLHTILCVRSRTRAMAGNTPSLHEVVTDALHQSAASESHSK